MKNTKDVISLIAQGIKTGVEVAKDKKVNLNDVPAFLEFAKKVPDALSGITEIPAELKVLSPEQGAELGVFAISELALQDGKAKRIVDASVKVALGVFGLVKEILSSADAPKAESVVMAAAEVAAPEAAPQS